MLSMNVDRNTGYYLTNAVVVLLNETNGQSHRTYEK